MSARHRQLTSDRSLWTKGFFTEKPPPTPATGEASSSRIRPRNERFFFRSSSKRTTKRLSQIAARVVHRVERGVRALAATAPETPPSERRAASAAPPAGNISWFRICPSAASRPTPSPKPEDRGEMPSIVEVRVCDALSPEDTASLEKDDAPLTPKPPKDFTVSFAKSVTRTANVYASSRPPSRRGVSGKEHTRRRALNATETSAADSGFGGSLPSALERDPALRRLHEEARAARSMAKTYKARMALAEKAADAYRTKSFAAEAQARASRRTRRSSSATPNDSRSATSSTPERRSRDSRKNERRRERSWNSTSRSCGRCGAPTRRCGAPGTRTGRRFSLRKKRSPRDSPTRRRRARRCAKRRRADAATRGA